MQVSKRGGAAALVVAALAATTPMAFAGSAYVQAHYATFSGRMNSTGTAGSTTICESVAGAASGDQPCSANWHITRGLGSICDISPGEQAGVGNFYDPNDGFSMTSITLFGAINSGGGVLVGYGISGGSLPGVFKFEVNAHYACPDNAQLLLQSVADSIGVTLNTRPIGDSWKGDVNFAG